MNILSPPHTPRSPIRYSSYLPSSLSLSPSPPLSPSLLPLSLSLSPLSLFLPLSLSLPPLSLPPSSLSLSPLSLFLPLSLSLSLSSSLPPPPFSLAYRRTNRRQFLNEDGSSPPHQKSDPRKYHPSFDREKGSQRGVGRAWKVGVISFTDRYLIGL